METNKLQNILSMVVLLAVIISCKEPSRDAQLIKDSTQSESIDLSDAQYKAINIKLAQTSTKKIVTTLQANGKLDVPPQNLVTISAPMGGFVKDTRLLQGMRISKGDVIAVLEHQDYIQLQQDYLDNASKLEYLEAEYKRQEALSKENINSGKTFQLAKSNYESAHAQVQGLRAKLRMLNIDPSSLKASGISPQIRIYSPLSGFVTEVNVNIGSFVSNVDPMFRIVDVKHLHAELQVYEKDIHKVKIGQKVNFYLPGETTTRKASVFLVGKEISSDRTVRVHCHLDQEDEGLLPGMYVTASIETYANEARVINSSAIISFDGQQGVFIKRGAQQFDLVKVKTGTSIDHLQK
jgi:membrane fusion protein, heavy metal efflux system